MRWLDGIIDMSWSKVQEIGEDREAWWAAADGVAMSRTWLSDCNNNDTLSIQIYS